MVAIRRATPVEDAGHSVVVDVHVAIDQVPVDDRSWEAIESRIVEPLQETAERGVTVLAAPQLLGPTVGASRRPVVGHR